MAWKVNQKKAADRTFYYVDVGAEDHGRTSFRLWVHPSLLTRDDKGNLVLEIPHKSVSLNQGKSRRTLILRPGAHNLFAIYVPCGYRGTGQFEILTPTEAVFRYAVFQSERGSLGVSYGALVLTPADSVTYRWTRTGRLYGDSPEGTTVLSLDGTREDLEETDLCEIEDLAEV